MKFRVLAAILLSCHFAFSQTTLITADQLFDGNAMHTNWGIVVKENRIVEVGPVAKLRTKPDTTISYTGGSIMPGMIEGHSHVLLYPYDQTDWNDQVLKESRSLRAIRGSVMAKRNLMAGFTTIRDLGSEGAEYADVAVKQSIEQGITIGPRMLVAGKAIVATGSYGPKGFHPDVHVPLGAEPADGNDLIRVVRDQIGNGADFIKVYSDYRWGPNKEAMPTFSLEELKLIVETAKSSGRVVVAHASTNEGMRRATLAGVVSIEHGTDASDEVLKLMKERNVALCPTLAATYSITKYRGWDGQLPEPEGIKAKRNSFDKAIKNGVTIVAGGDVGVFPHGENALELTMMSDYGMPNIDVLKSVTSVNAKVFKLKELGELKTGYLADIIVVDGNPEKDINALKSIKMVMKDGEIYKK
ncbi:amidohydrolase family protein [Fulvivirga lutimaris]|uniref:amidohydrolase family protein n=1 Tax=Fulvivirga lutimaris TaxID=1819566 RepID=UPI0012BB5A3D|nr:amidohydrolase family protein [Fulvivirga lutimaris]MTI41434.1 amidohydrolase family protein [Fulvivirga lutimaris]